MATFKDHEGREWDIRFSAPNLIKVSRKMKLKLNQLISMDLELADLIESLPILIGDQLKDRNIGGKEFLEALTPEDLTAAFQAFGDALSQAFPTAAKGEGTGPFDLGKNETSSS